MNRSIKFGLVRAMGIYSDFRRFFVRTSANPVAVLTEVIGVWFPENYLVLCSIGVFEVELFIHQQ